ncbi:MAG: hypothetical protein SNH27_10440 [Rikenellaceae bacterium]
MEITRMTYQQKLRELHNEVVAQLKSITDRPEGWLPHTVFVEDVCDIEGTPIYNQYKLIDFNPEGDCQLQNIVNGEIEDDKYLSEIETVWLVTLLDRYYELSKTE